MHIQHLFNSLIGNWQVTKQITPSAHMIGHASFTTIPMQKNTLLYQEDGLLTLPSQQTINANSSYFYCYAQGEIHVYFADSQQPERLFHTLEIQSNITSAYPVVAQAEHVCKKDKYQTTYHFIHTNQFTIEHQVVGPKKNYQIMMNYIRL